VLFLITLTSIASKELAVKMSVLKTPFVGFEYLPHQEVGVNWMMARETVGAEFCRGGLLADDMGLGKTWQTVGLLVSNSVPKTLLLAPPVLIAQWIAAFKSAGLMTATLDKGHWSDDAASVFITTYDRVRRNARLLTGVSWDRIVLDEGQYIRNKTQRFMAVSRLRGLRRWILSGTPVQNSKRDFANLATWLGCDTGAHTLVDLAQAVILRRGIGLLKEVMPPAPTHIKHDIEFRSAAEKARFNMLVGKLDDAIEQKFKPNVILELYLRIQMFTAHPQIYVEAMRRKYGGLYERSDWTSTASKLHAFEGIIKGSAAPTLVFCHFNMEMDMVASVGRQNGYNVFFVRGGLTEKVRASAIMESAASGPKTLLVCQITAANCGLNLQHLTRVIFYTQHWNPAVMDQAMTRSYRYGQQSMVVIHHLVLSSPSLLNIDRKMLQKHAAKREEATGLLASLAFAYCPQFVLETEEALAARDAADA